ncbi:MAG TPA: exodeoxyribonuclease VII large subunit [Acidimicrobiales bacterium]|nr:exodeoxyribonuclease VII large subunit [Acidimicrobiales bacterium]
MAGRRAVEELRFDFGANPAPAAPPEPSPAERELRVRGLEQARRALEQGGGAASAEGGSASPPAPLPSPGTAPEAAYTVAGFYARLGRAFANEFPDEIWVVGEIRKVNVVARGHRFIELGDREGEGDLPRVSGASRRWPPAAGDAGQQAATLDVVCWASAWPPIAAELQAVGLELQPGLVVRVLGRPGTSQRASKVRLTMSGLDVEALVGGIAAARRRLLATLEREGVAEANRRLLAPLVPLRVGLVTSAGSEAHRDFVGQLERSGFAFAVHLESSLVQGPEAPLQIAAALRRLRRRELDLLVLVRGGGAKGDLAAFDHEAVARAIVESPLPVWTGVGHTGDESVADLVAHRSFSTPTKVGEAVVEAVATYFSQTVQRAGRLAIGAGRLLDGAEREAHRRRLELAQAARDELAQAAGDLHDRKRRLELTATLVVERCAAALGRRAGDVESAAARVLSQAEAELERERALLSAFDPRRQLERGWSLTRKGDGTIVRSAGEVAPGDELVTVVADGAITSTALSARRQAAPGGEGGR